MGLTNSSVGKKAADSGLVIKRRKESDRIVALAGNPNVGKSTLFNSLTGMKQHTGNWPGKTVTNASGYCMRGEKSYIFVDIPGTYSLMAHSAEEETARNYICFGEPDAVAVVCDATNLERNLYLVLQTLEITKKVVVCVNLLDEAEKKNICVNLELLSQRLGVPVVGTVARSKKSREAFLNALDKSFDDIKSSGAPVKYDEPIERAAEIVKNALPKAAAEKLDSRWLSLKLLDADQGLIKEINSFTGVNLLESPQLLSALAQAWGVLEENGYSPDSLKDSVVSDIVKKAGEICDGAVISKCSPYSPRDRKIDSVLTGKFLGYPIMLAMLALIFWITICGANYPSEWLSWLLFGVGDRLRALFETACIPHIITSMLFDGIYRVLAWVVSVMLPPMAVFFPLFTLLEDSGFLPRVAYNLDKPFRKCNACGKQSLTMCMGFGCNAAGIVGCRIIDSPRERLLAILTNSFVPCNGRFPALIAVITMFFTGFGASVASSALNAVILTSVIAVGVIMTFFTTWLLSKTLLRGVPSSFTLELPPFRKPQIGKVIVRSVFDRTLFVLARSISVAAPAGLIIWIMANVSVGDATLLRHCACFLDPLARLLGLDGVILLAFILGFPANEIVIPIVIMAYISSGTITELSSLAETRALFAQNGWTWMTAVSFMIFSLMHWPCSTSVLTVKKETGSWKWALASMAIPTAAGCALCMIFTFFARLFSGAI